MPDSGTIRPTLTSAGACARATVDSPMAAAPDSTVRRVSEVFEFLLSWFIFVSSRWWFGCYWLHAEIGLADGVVRPQGLVVAFKCDAAGFEHVAVVGGFKGFRHPLFDQQDGELRLLADFDQPLEDEIGDRGCQAHRRLVQHQKFW